MYFWVKPIRIYLGFWKNGKQHGVGRYLTKSNDKFGYWENGIRKHIYKDKFQALSNLNKTQVSFTNSLMIDIEAITIFYQKYNINL